MINVCMTFHNQVDQNTQTGTVAVDCKIADPTKGKILVNLAIQPTGLPNQKNDPISFNLTWTDAAILASFIDDILNANPNS